MKAACKASPPETRRKIELPKPIDSPNIFTCATSDEEDSVPRDLVTRESTCVVHPKDNGVAIVVDNGVTGPRKLVLD